ncbi:hypothetical protein LP7551_04977 [Roseibium album]|nr:hypothetical protein LP7551_04977 [Roseibium album]
MQHIENQQNLTKFHKQFKGLVMRVHHTHMHRLTLLYFTNELNLGAILDFSLNLAISRMLRACERNHFESIHLTI